MHPNFLSNYVEQTALTLRPTTPSTPPSTSAKSTVTSTITVRYCSYSGFILGLRQPFLLIAVACLFWCFARSRDKRKTTPANRPFADEDMGTSGINWQETYSETKVPDQLVQRGSSYATDETPSGNLQGRHEVPSVPLDG